LKPKLKLEWKKHQAADAASTVQGVPTSDKTALSEEVRADQAKGADLPLSAADHAGSVRVAPVAKMLPDNRMVDRDAQVLAYSRALAAVQAASDIQGRPYFPAALRSKEFAGAPISSLSRQRSSWLHALQLADGILTSPCGSLQSIQASQARE
jgi:hypothetical protein